MIPITWLPLIGGISLGLCTAMKLLLNGRILGISGTFGGLISNKSGKPWRLAFLGGLLGGGFLLRLYVPSAFHPFPSTFPLWRILTAGFLVGAGANLGNGCTSGHGLSGLSRMSKRSLVYVLTFMAAGMASATLTQSAQALTNHSVWEHLTTLPSREPKELGVGLLITVGTPSMLFSLVGLLTNSAGAPLINSENLKLVIEALLGLAFALGLGVSGMLSALKVARFLDLSNNMKAWDPALALVMGGALLIALPITQWVILPRAKTGGQPLFGGNWDLPRLQNIDRKLLTGGILFGAGWGLAGMCPGPGLVSVMQPSSGQFPLLFDAAMAAGILGTNYLLEKKAI